MSKTDLNSLSLKKKQINVLKERFSHTIEVDKDSTFKIPFLGIHLLISLPVDFPNSPPAYFLEILQTHQPISLPSSFKWTPMNSLASVTIQIMEPYVKDSKGLENLIEQVRRQQILQQNIQQQQPPPTLQTQPQRSNSVSSPSSQYSPPPPYKDQPSSGVISPPTPNTPQRSNSVSTTNSVQPNNSIKIPSIPIEFLELKSKSIQELEELINNEDSMNAFTYSFDDVSELSDQKSKLLSENERLTKISDPLPNEIKQLKDEIETKKIFFEELNKQNLFLQNKKKEISDRYSQNTLLDKLNDSIGELELESDEIVHSFLNDSTLELKEFKKQFKEKRSLYHSKCANRENLMGH
ncbi:hypothetical protein DICPUDRAFT_26951 [Dictyostelium purpureum]|uniref:VPS37 C-terminal domain-containing protein n=1 Tax=Dictyostelium purpureum TaxID=5786 RepID=F0Z9K4_DICPU|nr:uncharacterized protein DICPUDRAFT_26951 [Dictyostelium purpureum]EGC39425.1 hypothetical protein DICPUDRAFT_26951 [Dictyostelium purpureum]|eukprot:XP_003284099.1 hypothetical protein DICPUDRAFT_26951 [Dictyostelium purpureum]